jgi:hypothetical protein
MRLPVDAVSKSVNIRESAISFLRNVRAIATKLLEVLRHVGKCVEMGSEESTALVHVVEVV